MKCARCGRELVEGDEAVEVDMRRIVIEGTLVEFVDDVDVYCIPCHDGERDEDGEVRR